MWWRSEGAWRWLALGGAVLTLAGMACPWVGRAPHPASFLFTHPWWSGILLALALLAAWWARRELRWPLAGAAVAAQVLGQVFFSDYYFGVPTRNLSGGIHAPGVIPGWYIFELGVLAQAAAFLSLHLFQRRRGRQEAAQAPPPPHGEPDLTSVWALESVGNAQAEVPVGWLGGTWTFTADGRVALRALGLSKTLRYRREDDRLVAHDPDGRRRQTYHIEYLDHQKLVLAGQGQGRPRMRLRRRAGA